MKIYYVDRWYQTKQLKRAMDKFDTLVKKYSTDKSKSGRRWIEKTINVVLVEYNEATNSRSETIIKSASC